MPGSLRRLFLFCNALFISLGLYSCSGISKSHPVTNDLFWSDIVTSSEKDHKSIIDTLKEKDPHLFNQIKQDAKDKLLLSFWGQSLNFDSGAKKQILNDELIGDLQKEFGIKNDNKIVHAGITHTYGYLFSVLNTPYGFKRKRWIEPTLNYAFALSGLSLSPETMQGGLLSNVTYFAGKIAFKKESNRRHLDDLKNVSSEVRNFDYSKLNVLELDEDIQMNGATAATLRTYLVKFPFKANGEENDYLLIYTASMSVSMNNKEMLITAFPIKKDAYNKIVNAENLGPNRPIQVRYNAYINGFMSENLTGIRKIH
jgi:hypothetical protein